jgi:integrase
VGSSDRALRWGEVDFAAETIRVVRSFTIGGASSPKSGKPRSVPMVREVATALGTRAVEHAESILELKEWMGHANVQTTMRYLRYKSKADAAHRLAQAFVDEDAEETHPARSTA